MRPRQYPIRAASNATVGSIQQQQQQQVKSGTSDGDFLRTPTKGGASFTLGPLASSSESSILNSLASQVAPVLASKSSSMLMSQSFARQSGDESSASPSSSSNMSIKVSYIVFGKY